MSQTIKQNGYMHLPMFIDQDENGVRSAVSPIFDGCMTQGYDLDELKENIEDVTKMYLDLYREGEPVLKGKKNISLTFDKNAKITNNFMQEIDQNSGIPLIYSS